MRTPWTGQGDDWFAAFLVVGLGLVMCGTVISRGQLWSNLGVASLATLAVGVGLAAWRGMLAPSIAGRTSRS